MQNRIIIYLLPIYVSALSYIGIGFNLSDTGWDFDGSQHVQRAYPLGNFSHQGSAASQSRRWRILGRFFYNSGIPSRLWTARFYRHLSDLPLSFVRVDRVFTKAFVRGDADTNFYNLYIFDAADQSSFKFEIQNRLI